METEDETDVKKKYYCEICDKHANSENQFAKHTNSKGHNAAIQKCNEIQTLVFLVEIK